MDRDEMKKITDKVQNFCKENKLSIFGYIEDVGTMSIVENRESKLMILELAKKERSYLDKLNESDVDEWVNSELKTNDYTNYLG